MRIDFKYCLLFFFLSFISTCLGAKSIKGIVFDKDRNPIFAVNIYLKMNQQFSTASKLDGSFELQFPDSIKNDTLVVSFLGYVNFESTLSEIDSLEINYITLMSKAIGLQEVNVVANPTLSREFTLEKVSKLDIYMTPGSSGDALKMVSMLSTSTGNPEKANPELRGSPGNMSRVLLNNVPIYEPVKNTELNGIGGFNLFNTELIDDMEVYASNPPVMYANATGGAISIKTRNKLDSNQTQLALSLANIGFLRSQRIKDHSFLQLYSNLQFSGPFLTINNVDDLTFFLSKDIGLNFNSKLSKHSSFNIYSYVIDEEYQSIDEAYNYKGEVDVKKKRLLNVGNLITDLMRRIHLSYQEGNIWGIVSPIFMCKIIFL